MGKYNANLSDCEEMILSIILESDTDPTILDIMAEAKRRFKKSWKMQTAATFLTRMEEKGYISRYKQGRYSHYVSKMTLDEFRITKLGYMKELLLFESTKEMRKYLKEHV